MDMTFLGKNRKMKGRRAKFVAELQVITKLVNRILIR
jgi:hypothetical protein